MKIVSLPLLAASLFAATPALAQDEAAETTVAPASADTGAAQEADDADAFMAGLFSNMFGEAVPLSAEAQARLPAAQQVVDLIFPEGSYAQMMETTMGGMSERLLEGLSAPEKISSVARLTGLAEFELMDVDEAGFNAALAVLDPVYEQRSKLVMEVATKETTEMMAALEPSYREGLANAYADRFTADQLADLLTFFKTPTGAHYAAQSMQIYADPHVLAKMNDMFPIMMERIPLMGERMEQAVAGLPPERYFDQLDAGEKAKLAEALGSTVPELDAAIADARAEEAAMDSIEGWSDGVEEEAVEAAEAD